MILIVDDDTGVCTSLKLLLKQAGYASQTASNPSEALDWLGLNPCQLVLQDMNFSRRTDGSEGLALLAKIKQHHHHLPVVLMTAWGSIGLAVEGMRNGATDFVTKPWTHSQILQTVRTAMGISAVRESSGSAKSRDQLDALYQFDHLVGQDRSFLDVLDLIGRVAPTTAPVLILGESGTGKEEIAFAVHTNSPRKHAPFVKVNLGGMATSLFESEMFGHTKGAFTDARTQRQGRFAAAEGGSIFLDEIGDLDPICQVKLLRVLQDRTFEPLGSSKAITVDVRIIAATNRPLTDMVAEGKFREDLYYRLNLIEVHLPPLRLRHNDIPHLALYFLKKSAITYQREPVQITQSALDWLKHRDWPGNIRELKQLIERCILVHNRPILDIQDVQASANMQAPIPQNKSLPVGEMTLEEVEQAMIEKALIMTDNNISQTAKALGISRAALYRRMEKFGITH